MPVSTQPFGRAPDGHLDVEAVSDLVEGLLTPEQAASVEEHLSQCEPCRDIRDALAEIHGTLGPQSPRQASPPGQHDDQAVAVNGTVFSGLRPAPRETATSTGDAVGPTPPRSSPRSSPAGDRPSPPWTVLALVAIVIVVVMAAIVILIVRRG